MKKQIILMLLLLSVLCSLLAGCGNQTSDFIEAKEIATGNKDDVKTEIGTGEKSFIFEITVEDGSLHSYLIKTDEEYVGTALEKYGLIYGERGEYGLYVKTVDGIYADYDETQSYWAFYINGKLATSAADKTEITEGAIYSFVYTKA